MKKATGRTSVTSEEFESWRAEESEKLVQALARIEDLEHKVGRLSISAPVALRALDRAAVARAVSGNPYVEFDVLEDWKLGRDYLPKGRNVRADLYPRLLDYVGAGLMLGLPENQDQVVSDLRAQGEAREAAIKHEVLATAASNLEKAREIAMKAGLKPT